MASLQTLNPGSYSLLCRTSPTDGEAMIEDFTTWAENFRQSIRWMGGYWEASWRFTASDRVPIGYLIDWFENRLFCRVENRVGSVMAWRGVVWTMDLTLDGYTERRDMGEVFNAVKAKYTDTGGKTQETNWSTNQTSIRRYGRREEILSLDNVTAAQAQAEVGTFLAESAEAHPWLVQINPDAEDALEVTAVGDIITANNRFVTAGDGGTGNLSTFVRDIITADCEFLTPGRITTNMVSVTRSLSSPMRAWDMLLRLTEVGDGSWPYHLKTESAGRLSYLRADNAPAYEWHGRSGGLRDRAGNYSPWLMQPGVVRNMKRRPSSPIPGTFFADGRDGLVAEVTMSQDADVPDLVPQGGDEYEIERHANTFRRWLERKGVS